MKALVIYDLTGKIWSIIYDADDENPPQGLLCTWVDIPDGAVLDSINVEDPKNPEPVFSYLPKTDIAKLQDSINELNAKYNNIEATASASVDISARMMRVQAANLSDSQALFVKDLYPKWSDLEDGQVLTSHEEAKTGMEITRVVGDDGNLYKVIKTHNKQSDWGPGQATSSLFTIIEEEHTGTKEDPIPARTNMEYFKDKYYIENDKLYLCTRDSETALQHFPSQLVGQYFEVVE